MSSNTVLVIDDQHADIQWLLDLIEMRGYRITIASTEVAGRSHLDAVKEGRESYALAIIDVMVAERDITELMEMPPDYFKRSMDAGIHLCRHARRTLGLSAAELKIIAVTVRDDADVITALEALRVPRFSRTDTEALRSFTLNNLPQVRDTQAPRSAEGGGGAPRR